MNEQNWEKLVTEKLLAHESEVPQGMWDRIQRSRRRRVVIAWWWSGLGIAAALVIYLLAGSTSKTSTNNTKDAGTGTVHISPPDTTKQNIRQAPVAEIQNKKSLAKATDAIDKQSDTKSDKKSYNTPKNFITIGNNSTLSNVVKDSVQEIKDLQLSLNFKPDELWLNQKNKFAIDVSPQDLSSPVQEKLSSNYRRPSEWFVEAKAGPAVGYRDVERKIFYPLPDNGKAHTEVGWHAGIMVGRSLSRRWTLKTGAWYTAFTESSKRSPFAIGSRYTEFGMRMLDITLIAGYQLKEGKWQVIANGGPMFNVSTKYSGYVSDTLASFQSIGRSGFVKKQTGLKAFGSVSILHTVNTHLEVFAEPSLIYHFGEMSNNKNYFSLRIHQLSASVGVKYWLSK